MKILIKEEITCGENTCATGKNEFCKYLGSVRFSTIPVCMLFPSEKSGSHTELEEKNGWIQRCEECKSKGQEQIY